MSRPTIKPARANTYHRDGTVSFWDIYRQQWRRLAAQDIGDRLLATMSKPERDIVSGICSA